MDINALVEHSKKTPNCALLDVRTPEEYAEGRIPGSANVPLQELTTVIQQYPNTATPLFIYCTVGQRAEAAVSWLTTVGYANAVNIGGIADYEGPLES